MMTKRIALFLAATAMTGTAMSAGPLAEAVLGMGTRITDQIQFVVIWGGPAMTMLGGGRAAWKAAHQEPFTTPLLAAIVGVALFAGVGSVSINIGSNAGYLPTRDSIGFLVGHAGAVLGGLVTLISGSIAGYKAANREPFVKQLIFAVVAAAIAIATIAAT